MCSIDEIDRTVAKQSRGLLLRYARFRSAFIPVLFALACGGSEGNSNSLDPNTPAEGPLRLTLGEVVDLAPDSETGAALQVQKGERYLLSLISQDVTPEKSHVFTGRRFARNNARPPKRERPAHSKCASLNRLTSVLSRPTRDALWRSRYRKAEAKVGDTHDFVIDEENGQAPHNVQGEAVWVGPKVVIWLDRTTLPLAEVADSALTSIAAGFTGTILPRAHQYFGEESDVDGNGRVDILFSPIVAKSAAAWVSPCDLIDPKIDPGCAVSNLMDLIYIAPPNAPGAGGQDPESMLETLAHEFQHLIYFHRKYRLNSNTAGLENPYITEGLSHLAQDLLGYQSLNLYHVAETLDHLDIVSLPNMLSNTRLGYQAEELDTAQRGTGYLLLRYLFDQAGGDAVDAKGVISDRGGIKWLRALVEQPEIGIASLEKATGKALSELIVDFWSALALSNRGKNGAAINSDPRYAYLPITNDPVTGMQRGCDLHSPLDGTLLSGPKTLPWETMEGKIKAGGAAYFELRLPDGEKEVKVDVKASEAAKLKVRLIRIK